MSELKLLPVLHIHQTDFYVDKENLELRQVDDEGNTISFYNIQNCPNHNEFTYDPKTKNAFYGTFEEMRQRSDLILVQVPTTIGLDSINNREKTGRGI